MPILLNSKVKIKERNHGSSDVKARCGMVLIKCLKEHFVSGREAANRVHSAKDLNIE